MYLDHLQPTTPSNVIYGTTHVEQDYRWRKGPSTAIDTTRGQEHADDQQCRPVLTGDSVRWPSETGVVGAGGGRGGRGCGGGGG